MADPKETIVTGIDVAAFITGDEEAAPLAILKGVRMAAEFEPGPFDATALASLAGGVPREIRGTMSFPVPSRFVRRHRYLQGRAPSWQYPARM